MAIVVAWLVLALAGTAATVRWAVKIWKRGETRGWLKALTGLVAATAVLGTLGTVIGLVKAFGAVGGESLDPSQKARVLAEGIAGAMNYTAVGVLLWLPSMITLTILSRRRKAKTDA